MLTKKQREERIEALEEQIGELRAEDNAADFFDDPVYENAISGLKSAIDYHRRMLGQST